MFVLAAALALPAAEAQLIIGDEAAHKRLEVVINDDGSAHVLHEIQKSAVPVTMLSVGGEYENFVITDADGNEPSHAISRNADGFGVTIFGSPTDTVVEYDLTDAVTTVGAYGTWDFYYPETTLFAMPESAGRVYINGGSVNLGDATKINCHGCEALIEFTALEETYEYAAGAGHTVGVATVATPQSAGYDAETGAIVLELDVDGHAYVDVSIPKALLGAPYEAYYEEERLAARIISEDTTHADFQLRMPGDGVLYILGSSNGTGTGTGPPADLQDDLSVVNVGIAVIVAAAAGIGAVVFALRRRRPSTQ